MTTAIYYFSRTGISEKLAKELSTNKDSILYKIEDGQDWSGVTGFIKGGYYSATKKNIKATYRRPKDNEEIVLITPLWAGTLPPAVITFINDMSRSRITLIVTSGGSTLKDRDGFIKVIDVVGKDAKVTL